MMFRKRLWLVGDDEVLDAIADLSRHLDYFQVARIDEPPPQELGADDHVLVAMVVAERGRALVAAVKVPTTHEHADGVAAGIVAGLERLLSEHRIDPQAIAFIAHSTTQATNALLEGDVARVGVVLLGGALSRAFARFAPFTLAEGVRFAPQWFDGADGTVLDALARAKVDAVAVSEPFAVDRPHGEAALVRAARERGFAATSGAEVSTQYGLRARTRTAALNAAILPRMLRTSRVTATPDWRRSHTISQWTADSLTALVSGRDAPSAICMVPPIFSSKSVSFEKRVML